MNLKAFMVKKRGGQPPGGKGLTVEEISSWLRIPKSRLYKPCQEGQLSQFGSQAMTPDVLDVLARAVIPEEHDTTFGDEWIVFTPGKKSNTFSTIVSRAL